MLEISAKLLLAYLLGTVMGGQVVGALRGGVDLRTQGSGNVGATNALRTQGKAFALAVLVIDVMKGVLAVLWLPQLSLPTSWPWPSSFVLPLQWQAYLCGIAVALGHCYPVFYRFRGGKGVATLAGVFACLLPAALPWMLALFTLTLLFTGYVSLATLAGTLFALFHVAVITGEGLLSPVGIFTLLMCLLVTWKHRDNIIRLLRGTENKFEKARVLARWISRWMNKPVSR